MNAPASTRDSVRERLTVIAEALATGLSHNPADCAFCAAALGDRCPAGAQALADEKAAVTALVAIDTAGTGEEARDAYAAFVLRLTGCFSRAEVAAALAALRAEGGRR